MSADMGRAQPPEDGFERLSGGDFWDLVAKERSESDAVHLTPSNSPSAGAPPEPAASAAKGDGIAVEDAHAENRADIDRMLVQLRDERTTQLCRDWIAQDPANVPLARARLAELLRSSAGAPPEHLPAPTAASGVPVATAPAQSNPTRVGPSSVFDQWSNEGPLVHEPTGLAIDSSTGGGPVYGSRWYLMGPPDGAKTAILMQVGDTWARRGVTVGVLAVDEEPSDLQTRLLQRRGFTRGECERRDPVVLERMRAALGSLPIIYYGHDWTIEAAAEDISRQVNGGRAALLVDSVQTVRCNASKAMETSGREVTERSLVTSNVRAIRAVATRHRLIVIATSEMNRASYRTVEQADQSKRVGDIASGKESGAIEYSGRVVLSSRSVEGAPDRFEIFVAKNKHGPRGESFSLALDRTRMTLIAVDAPSTEEIEKKKNEKALADNAWNAARLAVFLAEQPGVLKNDLHAGMRDKYGKFSELAVNVAIKQLRAAIKIAPRPNRGQAHFIHGERVPQSVLAIISDEAERRRVLDARWPDDPPSDVESDAAELYDLDLRSGSADFKRWRALANERGWNASRFDKARELARRRLEQAHADWGALHQVRLRGDDPQAWATEDGWDDARILAAMRFAAPSVRKALTQPAPSPPPSQPKSSDGGNSP